MRYSGRDSDLRGDRSGEDAETPLWAAPTATAPLAASLVLPGSKSITNRELVLAALADSPSRLVRPLHSRDSALMIAALRGLGTEITEVTTGSEYGPDLQITPAELTAWFAARDLSSAGVPAGARTPPPQVRTP